MLKPIAAVEDDYVLEHTMAAVAAAMADPSRVKMLCALMDGRAWTATELSAVADIAASTASAHLARLTKSHLVTCLSQGRHRYYRLAGSDIAALIEAMMGISWPRVASPRPTTPVQMRHARTCYDHLAGEVAVNIYDAMQQKAWITPDGARLTAEGERQLQKLGMVTVATTRRKPCCACLDWSERRFHLGGYVGAAFFALCEHQQWLTRVPGYREVTLTGEGRQAFNRLFNLAL
jgi:DNA-binding transcriptional ArsR family regulator